MRHDRANDDQPTYNVFTRTWWKEATTPGWPKNLEPEMGRKRYLAKSVSWDEAHKLCREYNSTHKPGRYSRKAEFEQS